MKGTGICFPGRNTSESYAGAAYSHHSRKKKDPDRVAYCKNGKGTFPSEAGSKPVEENTVKK